MKTATYTVAYDAALVARTLGYSNTPDREAGDPVARLLWPSGIYFDAVWKKKGSRYS